MSRIVASSLLGNILEETGHFSIRREKLACKPGLDIATNTVAFAT